MKSKDLDMKTLVAKAGLVLEKARRFSVLLFVIFVAVLYGFVLLRINELSNEQPSPDSVTSQVQAAHMPHIDKAVVKQLDSLHDNSVNVQALFNQARSNPFNQ